MASDDNTADRYSTSRNSIVCRTDPLRCQKHFLHHDQNNLRNFCPPSGFNPLAAHSARAFFENLVVEPMATRAANRQTANAGAHMADGEINIRLTPLGRQTPFMHARCITCIMVFAIFLAQALARQALASRHAARKNVLHTCINDNRPTRLSPHVTSQSLPLVSLVDWLPRRRPGRPRRRAAR
jgi:hypothetical protein